MTISHLHYDERRVINRVLGRITTFRYRFPGAVPQEAEVVVSVRDEECWVLKKIPARQISKIREHVADTDTTILCIDLDDGSHVFEIVLVHGNGEDVVHDISWPKDHDLYEKVAQWVTSLD